MGGQHPHGWGYLHSPQNIEISPEICKIKKYFIEVRWMGILSTMKATELVPKTNKEKAIELFATNPDIGVTKVAELLGLHRKTVESMRKDPSFHQRVQDRFMLELENDIPSMVSALKREVLAGNVQATRLMFEYMNKLQKNINITIDSPFENWMKKQELGEAEVITDELPIEAEFKDLPPRTANNSHLEIHKERVRIKNAPQKEKSIKNRNKSRREQYKWLKRAEAVKVRPLSAKRPTPGQKQAWQEKIIAKEKLASQSLQEQVGSSKTPCKPKSQKQESLKIPTPPKT